MDKKNKKMTHAKLTKIAYRWLLSIGCSFAFRELKTCALEQADAIGWKNGYSILVECKTSWADFRADQKKHSRMNEWFGVGSYRFYLCPERLIIFDIWNGKCAGFKPIAENLAV